jgi:hypothetical protein
MNKTVSTIETLNHLLVGASLGAILALGLLVGNKAIAHAVAGQPSPQLFMLGFILITSAVVAVGSSITGFIFTAIEKS